MHSESIYPYNLLEIDFPVSRVSSALRCENRYVLTEDLWLSFLLPDDHQSAHII